MYEKDCIEFNHGPIHIPKPDSKNGIPGKNITLMFINERPGRIGPGQTDIISFCNPDPSARWFKYLFNTLGVDRKKVFITNACIYYPIDKNYLDKPPSKKEIKFSAPILLDQIKRVKPKIIVSLGNAALFALKIIFPNSEQLKHFRLKYKVGNPIVDTKPYIFPLYHTSARARIFRKEKDQKRDWASLRKFMRDAKTLGV